MANSRSSRKRIRSSEAKRVRNRTVRSAVRTKITRARRALGGVPAGADGAGAEADVREAIQALDRAAEKGILHRNNARRRKSRLASLAAATLREAETAPAAARPDKGRGARGAARGEAPAPAAAKSGSRPAGGKAAPPAGGKTPKARKG